MKKKIFTLLALFAGVLSASADNTLAVSDAIVTQGKTSTFSIEMINTNEITACQFNLILPTGITFNNITKTSRADESHSVGKATTGQNTQVTFNSSSNALISGNSGALFVVTVDVDAEMALGNVTATLANIEMTRPDEFKYNPEDVDFTITVTDKVIIDENAIVAAPAQNSVDVIVKRTIKKDVWNTILLPFAMNKTKADAVFGEDAIYAKFTSFATDLDMDTFTPTGITMNFTQLTLGGLVTLAAGTPYLVKTTKDIDEFEVTGVNINNTIKDVSVTDSKDGQESLTGKFTGSLVKTVVPNKALFISGNKFWYSTGKTNIKGLRGWFVLDPIVGEALDLGAPVYLNFDGETTKIDVTRDFNIEDGQYYNLKGQKVDNPTEKGVYIKNGKKVVIK